MDNIVCFSYDFYDFTYILYDTKVSCVNKERLENKP